MKFICFGYTNENWEKMSEREKNKIFDVCFAYDDELRAKGHFLSGEALENANSAVTVRMKNGKAFVSDGPFIETKELLGGVAIIEAKDLNEAIALWSRHPALGVSATAFEIRPVFDMSPLIDASKQRRKAPRKS